MNRRREGPVVVTFRDLVTGRTLHEFCMSSQPKEEDIRQAWEPPRDNRTVTYLRRAPA